MGVSLTGDWGLARRLLAAGPQRLQSGINAALRQEAHALRREVVQGLTQQAPGGTPIRPLAPATIAARQLTGFNGTKALIERGDMRNSVSVIVEGDEAFVGIARTARAKDGRALVDIAELHEFGGAPRVIPITPRMRRFLFAVLRRMGVQSTGRRGRGVIVVQVPERPFLRPAFERFRVGASRRFLERVGAEMGFGG